MQAKDLGRVVSTSRDCIHDLVCTGAASLLPGAKTAKPKPKAFFYDEDQTIVILRNDRDSGKKRFGV